VRRREREITSRDEICAILARERVVRIAFAVGGEPYLLPLSYGYDPARDELYLHTAPAGRKIHFIEQNPRVCFEIEGACRVRPADTPCSWGLSYESLIGYGTLLEVVDAEEKARALSCLMRQQSQTDEPRAFPPSDLKAVRVWRLTIETISGKRAN
jgi:nitroimidazol reductase NimA-like FMN-containing flavoprotein (pyridoxamine 5'-phosphate oxidase superfamily)